MPTIQFQGDSNFGKSFGTLPNSGICNCLSRLSITEKSGIAKLKGI